MATQRTDGSRTFSTALREQTDDTLAELLRLRPDLGVPPPSSFLSLAARATAHGSLERALSSLDALNLAILECAVALGDPVEGVPTQELVAALGIADDTATAVRSTDTVQQVGAAENSPRSAVLAAVDRLAASALLWQPRPGSWRPSPGLAEFVGPYPAGLGPVSGLPVDPAALTDLPAAERRILDALAWGPPIGIVPASGTAREATDRLVERGLLERTDDRHVLLPGEVGLSLRGGLTHRDTATAPPRPAADRVGTTAADAEAALAGLEALRLTARLINAWQENPPSALRAGGLAVRDLRRLAHEIGADERATVVIVEIAAAAGLVADDRQENSSYGATTRADAWLDSDPGVRWGTLARAWWTSRRTTWQVGSRDERGSLRAALAPDLWRSWVPGLRSRLIGVLAARPGDALDGETIAEVLRWITPRNAPPPQAIAGLLDEAAILGVTGAGALSSAGRALACAMEATSNGTHPSASGSDAAAAAAGGGSTPGTRAPGGTVATAFDEMLPAQVDELLLQGDLTGIVPGRPAPALERLLDVAADVESRGAATTVRFTADSIVRALDGGHSADSLLSRLARFSRTPVPQPLEYLVRDAARRHGRVRVGTASAYLRSDDAALVAELAEQPTLRPLGLTVLAPTVLAAQVPAAELQSALRGLGVASVIERPDGTLVVASRRPARIDPPHEAAVTRSSPTDDARHSLIARLRAAERGQDPGGHDPGRADTTAAPVVAGPAEWPPAPDAARGNTQAADAAATRGAAATHGRTRAAVSPTRTSADGASRRGQGTDDPASSLGLLREAIADGALVWIELVGPDGAAVRRRVKPLTLDGGRLRARDPDREAELTVVAHRIGAVTRDDGPPNTERHTT